MNRDELFIYINEKGQTIEFSIWSEFFLSNITGIDGLSNLINTYKGINQDGATYIESSIDIRNIVIEGVIKANKPLNRGKMLRIINPKLNGVLVYKNKDIEKVISCRIEKAPVITKEQYPKFLISLICHKPFWEERFLIDNEIIAWIGGATFPLSFPISFSTKWVTKKNIINEGDVDTPIEVSFKGPALNPKVTNVLTGEFIRVKRALTADDTLLINTEFGNKKVEILNKDGSKTNAFNYIDLNSTFFQLQVGDNVLEYSSEGGIEASSVSVKYKNRYLGV